MAKKLSTGDELFGKLEDWRKKNLDPDPFDDPKYHADFKFWKGMPIWTAHDAITLSLGKDPNKISYEMATAQRSYGELEESFRSQYTKRFQILDRSWAELNVQPGKLYRECTKLESKTFMRWAKNKWVKIPPGLKSLVRKPHTRKAKQPEDPLANNPTWNHLESMARQAIDEYPEWRDSRRSTFVKDIEAWISDVSNANAREAHIITKILSDHFKESP